MKKLSPHVSDMECRCRCCGAAAPDGMDPLVLGLFEEIRQEAGGEPIHINCGYRCPKHNKEVGGVKNSQHLKGRALDLTPRHISVRALYKIADRLNPSGGVGVYRTFVHIDSRRRKARWKGKGVK